MEMTLERVQDVLVVGLGQKRATMDDAKAFKDQLMQQVEKEGVKKILIDFSDVDFADSTFIGALVAVLKRITIEKGDIKVLNLRPPVRAMFELTRLYKIFEIFDNKQDALNSF